MKTICLQIWMDWAMLKHELSSGALKVMEAVEDAGKKEEAMSLLEQQAGPLKLSEVDSFITNKMLDELGIKKED